MLFQVTCESNCNCSKGCGFIPADIANFFFVFAVIQNNSPQNWYVFHFRVTQKHPFVGVQFFEFIKCYICVVHCRSIQHVNLQNFCQSFENLQSDPSMPQDYRVSPSPPRFTLRSFSVGGFIHRSSTQVGGVVGSYGARSRITLLNKPFLRSSFSNSLFVETGKSYLQDKPLPLQMLRRAGQTPNPKPETPNSRLATLNPIAIGSPSTAH